MYLLMIYIKIFHVSNIASFYRCAVIPVLHSGYNLNIVALICCNKTGSKSVQYNILKKSKNPTTKKKKTL